MDGYYEALDPETFPDRKAEIEAQSTGRSIVTAELAPMPITGFANGSACLNLTMSRFRALVIISSILLFSAMDCNCVRIEFAAWVT